MFSVDALNYNSTMNNCSEISDVFYSKLFEQNPGIEKLFPSDIESLKDKFSSMIKYLYYIHDKKTIFHDAVILLCKRHKGIGVQIDHFDIVKNIFIESLCEVAGIEPNSEIARNWSDIIDYIRDAFAEC